ncbi:MAG: ribosome silencing factor [Clostridia bacterium]|nr:ribosome silencing factor [Clostridia bacterium]
MEENGTVSEAFPAAENEAAEKGKEEYRPAVAFGEDGVADARSLALAAGEVLDRRNGKDISVLFVGSKINLTDYFVICSGGSETHVRALADEVEYRLSLSGVKPDNREGRGDGNSWIVLDYGSVMVHIFTGEARRFYELDRLFPDAEKINAD